MAHIDVLQGHVGMHPASKDLEARMHAAGALDIHEDQQDSSLIDVRQTRKHAVVDQRAVRRLTVIFSWLVTAFGRRDHNGG